MRQRVFILSLVTCHQSLLFGRFPEFDAVTFGVHDPTEVSEIGRFCFRIDIDTFAAELSQERVEIVDAVIDHEWFVARFEVFRGRFERRPHNVRLTFWFKIGAGVLLKSNNAPILDVEPEMLFVPGDQFLGIIRLEENSADADDAIHFNISLTAA